MRDIGTGLNGIGRAKGAMMQVMAVIRAVNTSGFTANADCTGVLECWFVM